MNKKTKEVLLGLGYGGAALVGIVLFGVLLWMAMDGIYYAQEESAGGYRTLCYWANEYPSLRPMIRDAIEDDCLTRREWGRIYDAEREIVRPEILNDVRLILARPAKPRLR